MTLAIKEICIFMLIAQAILFFVPGGTYMKYVRILVGILMILWITEPLLEFWADEDTGMQIQKRMTEIFKEAEENGQMLFVEDGSMGIHKGIEEELKKKLVSCRNDYAVKEVVLDEAEGVVVITVELQKGEKKTKEDNEIRIPPVVLGIEEVQEEKVTDDNLKYGEIQELKEQYGNCIGIDPESIVVRMVKGTDRG